MLRGIFDEELKEDAGSGGRCYGAAGKIRHKEGSERASALHMHGGVQRGGHPPKDRSRGQDEIRNQLIESPFCVEAQVGEDVAAHVA